MKLSIISKNWATKMWTERKFISLDLQQLDYWAITESKAQMTATQSDWKILNQTNCLCHGLIKECWADCSSNNYFIILLIQQVILMPQSSKQFLIDLDLMKNSWSMSIIATSTCWYLQVSLLNAERMLKDYEPLILLRQRIFNLND